MFECERCGKKSSMRTEHLLHISVCNRYQCLISDETEGVTDNTDDSGGSHDFNIWSENTGLDQRKKGSFSTCSSPLTNEQRGIAEYAESMLLPETNQSPVLVEQAPIAEESENMFHNLSSQKTSAMRLSRQQTTKKKLKDIQKLIETWKLQKKQAVNEGKCNKARRLSKKIKKMQSLETVPGKTHDSNPHLQEPLEGPNNLYFSNTDDPCLVEKPPIAEQLDLSTEDNTEVNIKSGKKKNFCKFCKSLKTNYSRHIEQLHPDTEEGRELIQISTNKNLTGKEKRKLKLRVTERLRKLSNAEWNSSVIAETLSSNSDEKETSFIPVKGKNKRNKDEPNYHNYTQCTHCHGLFLRRKISVHIKNCTENETVSVTPIKSPSKRVQALKEHSIILTPIDYNLEAKFKEEILNNMVDDQISRAVKSDPLILKMGQEFHKSRRHSSERNYCSREMRDLGRLLLQLRKQNQSIQSLEDSLTPANFSEIIKAVEVLNGYDKKTGKVKVVGLAYRLLQPLQQCMLLLRKQRIEELPADGHDRSRLDMVNDLIQLIKDHWSNQLGRHSTKSMKELKSLKRPKMALEEDIRTLCKFIISKYDCAIELLDRNPSSCAIYDDLLDTLVSHIMCLARRRPVDLTRGTLGHLDLIDKNDDLLSMLKKDDMDHKDIENCKNFHVFFVPGKNYEKVPIVLTKKMKEALDCLVRHRTSVGITSELLFLHSNNRTLDASQSLERMKKFVQPNLINPKDLTGNGLRHQAATFSKFHSSDPLYQDHLATTLGHTLFIHKKNYDLPTSIAQKTIVCPILHKMTGGDEINSNVGECEEINVGHPSIINNMPYKRIKWSSPEKKEVYKKFGEDILKGVCPKRKDIINWKNSNRNRFEGRTDASLVTFIHNAAKRKILTVSPDVKRARLMN